jgi:Fe-Mn family superoxide dismutase
LNQALSEELLATVAELKIHRLPALKYDYAALEPWIDARSLRLHHDAHHRIYVENLNEALEKHPEFRKHASLWLLLNLDKLPEDIRVAVRHNAGGHVNHSMFWRAMKPAVVGEPEREPGGALAEAIKRDFGSFAAFKTQFEETGTKHFGSGWVWLVRPRQPDGKLEIITTHGHDHPQMEERFPILLNDVWEHAYYLQYEYRRAGYLHAWWPLVDWDEAARCFDLSDNSAVDIWEDEGGNVDQTGSKLQTALAETPAD